MPEVNMAAVVVVLRVVVLHTAVVRVECLPI
jgi:hypothetical protein